MRRTKLPAYDELVVRELLVNALVHRPYTQRGDIYLSLHTDCLEVANPGRLPIDVTPKNILRVSRGRRVDARINGAGRPGACMGVDSSLTPPLVIERSRACSRVRRTTLFVAGFAGDFGNLCYCQG
jgi:hypothetical protein